ncbi:hypothetical protein IFJ82_07320 [Novacetimonas hansenii]|uniref:hypothetical protein n=1 Tax=Novacetimonas hansenii TaxID=436 RepID=UPI00177DDD1F|nr:hypothetical protein [Novacetimonas hansenii]QOF96352.1 hypothetical protein IFJ82_07320 [Novacetimonas hansenii]
MNRLIVLMRMDQTPLADLMLADRLNGVQNTGLAPRDIANRDSQYIAADTSHSRLGILAIGDSPIGWRRPYQNAVALGQGPGDGETEL